MENYVKTALYAYPLLKNVEEDYATHIRNKALLSYNSNTTAERLAEYLAGEILCKERLLWLKKVVSETLEKLSETERSLVSIRYFGRARTKLLEKRDEEPFCWSERKYFRMQNRLSEKLAGMLTAAGLTKDYFDKELAELDEIKKIHRFVEEGRDRKIALDERRWLGQRKQP